MSTIRDFVPLTKLGEGTYSTVYKVRRLPDDQIYALKKVKMTQLTTK
jgi:NIMA (never in mitosis gene a)-related kinase